MKDQGMPLGDFRFCFPYEPCSQELKARMAALNAVTGAQIRANLARAAREAEMARLEAVDRRVKVQMRAEAQYTKQYMKILGAVSAEAWRWLYAQAAEGGEVTLLCYCRDGQFCHTNLIV